MPRAFALTFSILTLALAAVPTRAGIITGSNGVNQLGEFIGTVTYSPLNDTSALLEFQLINTSPLDSLTFAIVIGLLCTLVLTACLVPASRAMRLDPVAALRHE